MELKLLLDLQWRSCDRGESTTSNNLVKRRFIYFFPWIEVNNPHSNFRFNDFEDNIPINIVCKWHCFYKCWYHRVLYTIYVPNFLTIQRSLRTKLVSQHCYRKRRHGKHRYSDIVLQEETGNEILWNLTLKKHLLLSAVEGWVIHFTCEDLFTPRLVLHKEDLQT